MRRRERFVLRKNGSTFTAYEDGNLKIKDPPPRSKAALYATHLKKCFTDAVDK